MTLDTTHLIALILGMFLVTYPSRLLPILLFNHHKPPKWMERWLQRVPLTIFAALLVQIITDASTTTHHIPWVLITSVMFTLLLTLKTHSFGWGVGIGFPVYIVLSLFL